MIALRGTVALCAWGATQMHDMNLLGAARLDLMSAELEAQLAALQAAAIASPAREPKQDAKKQKSIPKQLKEMLPALSCTLNR